MAAPIAFVPPIDYAARYQRAIALLQLLINAAGAEQQYEIEKEARAQLKAWGVKVPKRRDDDFEEDDTE